MPNALNRLRELYSFSVHSPLCKTAGCSGLGIQLYLCGGDRVWPFLLTESFPKEGSKETHSSRKEKEGGGRKSGEKGWTNTG